MIPLLFYESRLGAGEARELQVLVFRLILTIEDRRDKEVVVHPAASSPPPVNLQDPSGDDVTSPFLRFSGLRGATAAQLEAPNPVSMRAVIRKRRLGMIPMGAGFSGLLLILRRIRFVQPQQFGRLVLRQALHRP